MSRWRHDARDPGQVHAAGAVLDENSHIQAARNTVSTWKKSAARIVFAWASRNARQVCLGRVDAGSMPASLNSRWCPTGRRAA
jgi:hypothetical protein